MSEYQYYEFRAIDRMLDQDDMDALRAISTRAEITATSLTNTYHYGDFKGNIHALMDRYFDAFVYVANWGTRQLILRIPRSLLDPKIIQDYGVAAEFLELKARKDHVLLDFQSDEEGGGEWTEGEPWMPALVPLRDEIMRGDYRALYLGWLASIWVGECHDEDEVEFKNQVEPPVPPGLGKLSEPLRSLAEFLRIDPEMIEAAAQGSEGEAPAGPSRHEFARWVKKLPVVDKDDCLMRLIDGERDLLILADLTRRFREATNPKPGPCTADPNRRTVAQLLDIRTQLVEEKKRQADKKSAQEKAARDRKRSQELDQLARRETAAWREVDQLLATTSQENYDRALELIIDLRDLARRDGRYPEVVARLKDLRQTHRKKPSLIRRFDQKKLE